eukprot:13052930-Heterocapsa_arctica.AAC.1
MFAVIAEKTDDYKRFHELFGKCLKPGVYEDPTNRTKAMQPLRLKEFDSKKLKSTIKEGLDIE